MMATSNVDLFLKPTPIELVVFRHFAARVNTVLLKVLTSILQMPDDLLAIMNPLTAALMWFVLLIQWAISVFGDLIRFIKWFFEIPISWSIPTIWVFHVFHLVFKRFPCHHISILPAKRFVLFYEATKKVQQEAPKTNLCIWFSRSGGEKRMEKPNGETDPKRGPSSKESQCPHWLFPLDQ